MAFCNSFFSHLTVFFLLGTFVHSSAPYHKNRGPKEAAPFNASSLSSVVANRVTSESGITRSAQFGGGGGSSFDDSSAFFDDKAQISRIEIRSGRVVDKITIIYGNGKTLGHGGGGGTLRSFNLADGEFINSVDVRHGRLIDQLTFYTNMGKKHGPYGGGGGKLTNVNFQKCGLLHVFGRSGGRLDRIGFAYGPVPTTIPIKVTRQRAFGGSGGGSFNELVSSRPDRKITAIRVRHGRVIDAIQVQYDGVWGRRRGGGGGRESTFVIPSDDFLVRIEGRSGRVVDQLKFVLLSGRTSPVFGGSGGRLFSIKQNGGVIHAIYGKSGSRLDQIGAYTVSGVIDRVELLSISYDLGSLRRFDVTPTSIKRTTLINPTSSAQEVSQEESITEEVSSTVETSFTTSVTTEISFSQTFNAVASETSVGVTFGFGFEESFSESETISESVTRGFTFSASVDPFGCIEGTAILRRYEVDVSWTATANVFYVGLKDPILTEISGRYEEVAVQDVEATFKDCQASR